MKRHLLWKLLLINILPVIAVIILVIWLAIDQLAADYFMALMNKYDVSLTETHQMFLTAVHRYLLWATLAALALAMVLSYLLTRRVLRPLAQMTAITRQFAVGHYTDRVLITSHDEVGQLGEAFNRMADSLERIEKLRKTMVADVAHELRTPLTNLRGYLEALSDEVIPPSKTTFSMLEDETLRLVHLVESLHQLAKADAAKAHLTRETLSMRELIEQMLPLYQLPFASKNITLETDYTHESDTVRVDRDKMLQAIRNLLDNACRYTPDSGRMVIVTRRTEEGFMVRFTNSGQAIDKADLPLIFERFFQTDRSRSREKGGAGIGLAIVKELIEAHGGHVGAESSPGENTIWILLPE